jgi:hypothetical protein
MAVKILKYVLAILVVVFAFALGVKFSDNFKDLIPESAVEEKQIDNNDNSNNSSSDNSNTNQSGGIISQDYVGESGAVPEGQVETTTGEPIMQEQTETLNPDTQVPSTNGIVPIVPTNDLEVPVPVPVPPVDSSVPVENNNSNNVDTQVIVPNDSADTTDPVVDTTAPVPVAPTPPQQQVQTQPVQQVQRAQKQVRKKNK